MPPELRGHARTEDIERQLLLKTLADDVVALMKRPGTLKADILGNSLGGAVAMRLAIEHPKAVDRLVLVSQPFKRAGWYPEVRAAFDTMGPAAARGMEQSPLSALYPLVNWETLFAKLGELLRRDYDWSERSGGHQGAGATHLC